jgi:predicted house-cleaning noncanonical NTP pyrophosphatase (MazG superfamily)
MKQFKFSKLVRDHIVEKMISNDQQPQGVRKLGKKEFLKELKNKLLEESKELLLVENLEETKEEIADIYEVLSYIKQIVNLSDNELSKLVLKKRNVNGGFDKKIYISSVKLEENNKWINYYLANPNKYPLIKES